VTSNLEKYIDMSHSAEEYGDVVTEDEFFSQCGLELVR
jgi:hypothetical protein